MKRILLLLVVLLAATHAGFCDDNPSYNVRFPVAPGKHVKAVLSFHDGRKTIEVQPVKGSPVTVPYNQIDKVAYEYTLQVMGGKEHWLKIDYNPPEGHKVLLLEMSGHDYLKILDAVKSHTGMDAEVLGNADRGPK